MSDNLPLIAEAGITLLVSLVNGILSALPRLVAMVPKLISTLLTELVKGLPKLLQMGGKLLGELIRGLSQTIPKLLTAVKEIGTVIMDNLKKLPEKAIQIGTDLVKGLWNGIKDAVGWIKDKIVEFGDSVLQGLKDFFGIESPSKVMADSVGKYLALGIGEGFEDEMKDVTAQMQDALPTSFNTSVSAGSAESRAASNFDNMVQAFREALKGVEVVMDDEQMGRFIDKTTSQFLYA